MEEWPDAKRVVLTLGALGKSRQSASLAHAVHLSHAAGKDFVGIGLVTHIPDYAVMRCVVDIVQGDGKLDHAEAGAKMPARLAHAVQQVGPEFFRELQQFLCVQIMQRSALINSVQ